MFEVSDLEAGLAMGYNRSLDRIGREAMAAIDGRDAIIRRLQRTIALERRERSREQALRIAAETRLEVAMEMPGIGPELRRRLS